MTKRILLGMALMVSALAPAAFAQGTYNHAEIGAFFNYTRLHNANNTNFYGAGGRIGFNLSPCSSVRGRGSIRLLA